MIVDIDSGNSQLVTSRDGGKMLFYFTDNEVFGFVNTMETLT